MLKTVNRQIFYHIQHGNQKISKSGDILDIGSTENYFMGFYRTFNLNTVPLQTAYAELRRYWECKIVCVNRYCMNLLYAPYWGKQR